LYAESPTVIVQKLHGQECLGYRLGRQDILAETHSPANLP
jgi:hypothetical protein